MSDRKKVVIAGNYQQFLAWCRETDTPPSRAHYASRTEHIMGLELAEEDVVYTGEYWLTEVDMDVLRTRIRFPVLDRTKT